MEEADVEVAVEMESIIVICILVLGVWESWTQDMIPQSSSVGVEGEHSVSVTCSEHIAKHESMLCYSQYFCACCSIM